MMAIDRTRMESALSQALDPPPRPRRLPRGTVVAISVAAVLHAGLAAYLYSLKMSPPGPEPTREGPVITVTTLPPAPKPPKPLPRQATPRAPAASFHPTPTLAIAASVTPLTVPEPPPSGSLPQDQNIFQQPIVAAPPSVIENPDWLSRPTALEMTRYYPQGAMENAIGGKVVLACGVTASGALAGCQVLSETPGNQGFGRAALKLAAFFRLSPRTENGRPIDGAIVHIPLVFNAGE